MSLSVILTAFILIVPVELPDKTFVATLVLATRYRPLLVWIGVGLAFVVQTLVAVTFGRVIAELPHRPVTAVAAVLFLVGGVVLLRGARAGRRGRGGDGGGVRRQDPGRGDRAARRHRQLPRAVRRRVGRPEPAADRRAGRPRRPSGLGVHRGLGRAAAGVRRSARSPAGGCSAGCACRPSVAWAAACVSCSPSSPRCRPPASTSASDRGCAGRTPQDQPAEHQGERRAHRVGVLHGVRRRTPCCGGTSASARPTRAAGTGTTR